jgi:hypothetical protein
VATLSNRGKTASKDSALKANELLLWFSARREGSWHQFRRAVDELHADEAEAGAENADEFPLHQQLRLNFERLAHAEFRARECEDGWRVAPPTLAAQATNGGFRSVLCGARSSALQERLVYARKNLSCEVLTAEGVPDVFRFTSSDLAGLADVAAQAGIMFQADAPLALLSYLPPCKAPSRNEAPCDFPVGADWLIHQFDAGARSWRRTDRRHVETMRFGLIRFSTTFQRDRYFLLWKGVTFKRPRAVAIYVLLQRSGCRVLSYDPSVQTLTLPAICRPPRLLERALVLCSGLPPVYEPQTSTLNYSDVPLDIACFAAELLQQPLT